MTTATPARPDPNTVDHVHVATAARRRVADLTDQLLMRDAKLTEVHAYVTALEERLHALEEELAAKGRELASVAERAVGRAMHRGANAAPAEDPNMAAATQG